MAATKYHTTDEIAEMVRLDPSKIRQKIRQGEIAAINVGSSTRRLYRVSDAELQRWLRTIGCAA